MTTNNAPGGLGRFEGMSFAEVLAHCEDFLGQREAEGRANAERLAMHAYDREIVDAVNFRTSMSRRSRQGSLSGWGSVSDDNR